MTNSDDSKRAHREDSAGSVDRSGAPAAGVRADSRGERPDSSKTGQVTTLEVAKHFARVIAEDLSSQHASSEEIASARRGRFLPLLHPDYADELVSLFDAQIDQHFPKPPSPISAAASRKSDGDVSPPPAVLASNTPSTLIPVSDPTPVPEPAQPAAPATVKQGAHPRPRWRLPRGQMIWLTTGALVVVGGIALKGTRLVLAPEPPKCVDRAYPQPIVLTSGGSVCVSVEMAAFLACLDKANMVEAASEAKQSIESAVSKDGGGGAAVSMDIEANAVRKVSAKYDLSHLKETMPDCASIAHSLAGRADRTADSTAAASATAPAPAPIAVRGIATDAKGHGVPNVEVDIEETNDSAQADSTGHFVLKSAMTGAIKLRFIASGFKQVTRLVNAPATDVEVKLDPEPSAVHAPSEPVPCSERSGGDLPGPCAAYCGRGLDNIVKKQSLLADSAKSCEHLAQAYCAELGRGTICTYKYTPTIRGSAAN